MTRTQALVLLGALAIAAGLVVACLYSPLGKDGLIAVVPLATGIVTGAYGLSRNMPSG